MQRIALVLATLVSVAGFAAHAETPDPSGQFAHHAGSARSRADVRAELQEAQRTGDLLAGGDAGATLFELNPSAYPARAMVAGKPRDQVRQETLQAIRDGDIVLGESGLTGRQQFPQAYATRNGSKLREGFASRGAADVPVAQ